MEGVASEAAFLAGHLGLDNLIYLYDNNKISIESSTDIAFTEDRGKRFEAYGWFVQTLTDGLPQLVKEKSPRSIPSRMTAANRLPGEQGKGCLATRSAHAADATRDKVERAG